MHYKLNYNRGKYVPKIKKLMEENSNNILFLCGADISLDAPTSLPTVNKFVCDVLKESGISNETIDRVYNQFGKMNYRFESLVDQIRKNCDAQCTIEKNSDFILQWTFNAFFT